MNAPGSKRQKYEPTQWRDTLGRAKKDAVESCFCITETSQTCLRVLIVRVKYHIWNINVLNTLSLILYS
jgi:hypothetical protein